ncbi:uncharacterized protein N7515_008733 [Penicillium bovifimosum]|uniref:Uncharacterized protein n=1 Tax=Penicillium bovifimosum TaxID=126998 RepID=A0A9W9GNI1_9EURO|nr:uncharacterized protein N7515_008733 [Penicillium bovifimosum]KAJ5124908.1 hypothetical protein N7515_008733 [Penicillium bovifimosum]
MADSQTLYLASPWQLEECGLLGVAGQFDRSFESRVTSLLQSYVEQHRHDDLLEVPRISPIPTSFSAPREQPQQQPQTLKLLDDIPTQPINDQPNHKLWGFSQAGLGPISWDSSALFLRVAEKTETNITMKDRGLQVSAPDMVNADNAMRILTSLEKCFDLIENPNQGLIILTPERDGATYRIMTFEGIRDDALHRILIDRDVSISLSEIAAPVVCQFDNLANEFHPLPKLRQPPHVAPNPKLSTIRDWAGYKFSEIGHQSYYHNVRIDQHLAAKPEISDDKGQAHFPNMSAVHAKDVYKWISGDTCGKGDWSSQGRIKLPPVDESTSHELVVFKPPPEDPSEVSRARPTGLQRYMAIQRDGSRIEATQARRDDIQKRRKNHPFAPCPSNFAQLCQTSRELNEQAAARSSSATDQQTQPASVLRGNPGLESPGGTAGVAVSAPYTPGENLEPTTLLPRPIHPTSRSDGEQLVSIPDSEAKDSQVDTKPQVRSVDSVMEEPMLRIKKNESPIQAEMDAFSRQTTAHIPLSGAIVEKTGDPSPLIDLECDVNTLDSGFNQMVGLDQLAMVPSNVLRQSADFQDDQIQRSKTSAFHRLDDVFDLPNLESPITQFRLIGVPQSLQETSVLSDHEESTSVPVTSEVAAGISSPPGSKDLSSPYQVVRSSDEEVHQEEPKSGEFLRSFAKEYLLRHIDDHSGPETGNAFENLPAVGASQHDTTFQGLSASLSESNQSGAQQQQPFLQVHEDVPPVDASQIDDEPQCLSASLLDSDLGGTQQQQSSLQAHKNLSPLGGGQHHSVPQAVSPISAGNFTEGAQQRQSSHPVHGKVPVLRADLIDISPQSLSSHMNRRLLQRSTSNIAKQDTDPKGGEKLATTDETQTRDLRKTMFHQRPPEGDPRVANTENEAEETADTEAARRDLWRRRPKISAICTRKQQTEVITVDTRKRPTISKPMMSEPAKGRPEQGQSRKEQPPMANASTMEAMLTMEAMHRLSKEKKLVRDSTKTLFHFLEPILDAVRSFPGPLSLEIQFGLMFMPTVPASMKEKEMNYKQLCQIFFPVDNMTPPPLSMFERLTSSPADIDYLVDLKVKQRQLFDPSYSHRGIKYEFWCHTGSDKLIIISVNDTGSAMIRYPELPLGMVHLNFPSQVWDAAARIQGSIEYSTGDDPELEGAARAMAKSIHIESNNEQLRMLVQFPRSSNLRVEQVFMERWSRHPYLSQRSGDLALQITEVQELSVTPSVLDSGTVVVQNAPLQKMVEDGKQWWQASIVSSKVEDILKSNAFLEPGNCNESWSAVDLLGADLENIMPTANQGLSTLGAEVGYSGIGAMFQLAKTVVENMDAVGYWNKGPAATTSTALVNRSPAASRTDIVAVRQKPDDWRNQALVLWGEEEKYNSSIYW